MSLALTAKGKLEKSPQAGYLITEIVVKPKIIISSANDLTRMPRILERAKENCFVSNSLKSIIKIEPEISHRETPTSPGPL